MDNRIFNINGSGEEILLKTLELAFRHTGHDTTVKAWSISKEKGLVLHWTTIEHIDSNKLPSPLTAEEVLPLVTRWLNDLDIKDFILTNWDVNADHDGSNSLGWRVYVEDWGHIGDDWSAICAITPAYMWHGK